jgi:hypothetical protein
VLTKSEIKDKVKISDMIEPTGILSVNQTAAQIKLIEMWKLDYVTQYPIKMEVEPGQKGGRSTRSGQDIRYREQIRTKTGRQSFFGDAPKLWNKAPTCIKMAKTLYMAKKEIRRYCKSLPV